MTARGSRASPWPPDITVADAEARQRETASRVEIPDLPIPAPRTVAGLDVSYDGHRAVAAAVVVDVAGLQVVDQAVVATTVGFPYVPGLLAFREVPALLEALDRLTTPAELLLCDGQGLAHPRRCGVACHLGVITGLPAVGCAKNHLTGVHEEPGARRGDRSALTDGDTVLGHVLRTRDGVRPVYVSPGHRIGPDQATDLVLALCRHRIPEPVRHADHLSRLALREAS